MILDSFPHRLTLAINLTALKIFKIPSLWQKGPGRRLKPKPPALARLSASPLPTLLEKSGLLERGRQIRWCLSTSKTK